MSARRRLTVALVLTGDVAREIDGMRRALGATALDRIAPHVTLVPPVNVRDENLDEAVEIVRLAGGRSEPLSLELGPPATFWPVNPVVHLTVGGNLAGLAEMRQSLLTGPLATPSGRKPERDYVPHVTLDQNIDPARIDAALETLAHYRATVTVERVTVLEFQETLRRWHPIASPTLGRPKVVGRGGIEVELAVSSMLDPAAQAFEDREWEQSARETYGDDAVVEKPYAITARIAGEIVGTATGQLRGPVCRLGSVIVAADRRSEGVGSHLLKAVEQLALESGSERVSLEARADSRAVSFYRERGYEVRARLPNWRSGRDFLFMERRL
ncbi:MAG: GNAT family N-acetyltransferase [Acidimicrobiales bacterium]